MTLQAELEQLLKQNVAIKGFESSNGDGEYFGNLDLASVKVLQQAILATVSKHLPEKKVFIDIPEVDFTGKVIKVYKGETYTPYMIAYNTAITEMQNKLKLS